MNIWVMLMLRMHICECMNECKNEYMENVNVRSECGNGGMLGVNVLIGAMLGVNVRSECRNRGMPGMNALIGAI